MSTLLGPLGVNNVLKITPVNTQHIFHVKSCSKNVLKSKNIFKPYCNITLKRKLKKYKLRKDGKEDPDVINVSQTLLSTLTINSPNKKLNKSPNSSDEYHELRPKNYLFKMARRKLKTKPLGSDKPQRNPKEIEIFQISPLNGSQEKKQTNAFKLMMDSRNKSIGSNSPGKEKNTDPSEIQEMAEKKDLKVKRNLALQKMAEAKGSLKKKEMEKYQEECIKRKMAEREERLKTMLTKNKNKKETRKCLKPNKTAKNDREITKTTKESQDTTDITTDKNDEMKKIKTLQLVDLFNDDTQHPSGIVNEKKLTVVSEEDKEFLKKLSPSIKKKENMLCYFNKIEKKSESYSQNETDDIHNDNKANIIKVKMTSKSKKKTKKNKLSLTKNEFNEVLKDHNEKYSCDGKSENLNEMLKDQNEKNSCGGKTENLNEMFKDHKEKHSCDGKSQNLNHFSGQTACTISSYERRKRKRKDNGVVTEINVTKESVYIKTEKMGSLESNVVDEGRPKRQVKKPVKYIDDVQLSSSDEELHIFTPKKRKQIDNKSKNRNLNTKRRILSISDDESNDHQLNGKETKVKRKTAKLAPIFTPTPKLTPEEIEAKQKFLHSGIPEQLKKIISQKKKEVMEFNDFPSVVHVQQNTLITSDVSVQSCSFYSDDELEDEDFAKVEGNLFTKLLSFFNEESQFKMLTMKNIDVQALLQNMKELNPKFPVYRTYRLLKGKSRGEYKDSSIIDLENSIEAINGVIDINSENPECLAWTQKYRATSTNHLIGNFESIRELKKWLISWTENQIKSKNTPSSDSSDFCYSDADSRDSTKTTNNLLILVGPVGCGKTSSVYAAAAELAIKVIEVNASSKRNGKLMLQDLQEATQSHKVNRGNGNIENSQKSQEITEDTTVKHLKKKGRPKKSSENMTKKIVSTKKEVNSQSSGSQDSIRTGMSLILIDDVDIVFDQDDGFSSAIAQLIHSSKRPVILVTSSVTCPHLQRFLQWGKVMNMRPLLPKILGTWLDIMCLVDIGICWPGLGAKFLDLFKGDVRKTINCLQFYMTTNAPNSVSEIASQNIDNYYIENQDENSSTSWADNEVAEDRITTKDHANYEDVWKHITIKQLNLLTPRNPLDLFNMWWSVPSLLNETFSSSTETTDFKHSQIKELKIKELETIADVMDSFSVADYFSYVNPNNRCNITSQPWSSFESDSVSELENLDNFNRSHDINNEIIHTIVTTSIINAQKSLQIENVTEVKYPSMAEHRERNKIISRHENLTNFLNVSAVLDRRALALDYWSACRTICRTEKTKTDTVSKRNNRFCHYFKSFNVTCRNDSFDKLGDSLYCRGKNE